MKHRKCPDCKKTKEYNEFHKNCTTKTGVTTYCKKCVSVRSKNRIWTKKSLRTHKEKLKKWYTKNRIEVITRINNWHRERDNGLYFKYLSMLRRCKYKSQTNYKYYGGRGIKVEWKSYDDFRKNMYKSYINHLNKFGKKDTTLDRIDVEGNYSKENCRWATLITQANNKKNNLSRLSK